MTKRDEIALQAARAMKEAAERKIAELLTRDEPRIDRDTLETRRERIATAFKPRILRDFTQ